MEYAEFLERKRRTNIDAGFRVDPPDYLYDFQKVIFDRAVTKGRYAVFADCGLGKTPIQLAWADAVARHTNAPVLILAPLAVSEQTKREGAKFGVDVNLCRSQSDVKTGVNITNYEMLHHFERGGFAGIVLDESSILKNYGGHYRKQITEFANPIGYRLACTATPAPNDLIEIINHAEFLSVMSGKEAIAMFFRQDGNTTHAWRLKGHAQSDFWAWMASWCVAVRKPSDLGFDDGKFTLPKLNVIQHQVDGHVADGWLFPVEAHAMIERLAARRESINDRVEIAATLANKTDGPFLCWCNLNSESAALTNAIPDAVEVKGSDSPDKKRDALVGFTNGDIRALVTKPSIAGWGMNWQHCRNMSFVGLSDSWEEYYQAVRRCWRFGQTEEVNAHVVCANTEGAVVQNIERKEREASNMMAELVNHMSTKYGHQKDDSRYFGTQAVILPLFMRR